MIKVGHILVSDALRDVMFVCRLAQCKGSCCVEGELGAPLEDDELPVLSAELAKITPYLSVSGRRLLRRKGAYVLDEEGDFSTPTLAGRECAYAVYDAKGILKCGIERAYLDGSASFRKPISCHLYPARVMRKKNVEAINYHQWSICSSACAHGERLGMPLYVFLKEPLVRKYGAAWYRQLAGLMSQKDSRSDSAESVVK